MKLEDAPALAAVLPRVQSPAKVRMKRCSVGWVCCGSVSGGRVSSVGAAVASSVGGSVAGTLVSVGALFISRSASPSLPLSFMTPMKASSATSITEKMMRRVFVIFRFIRAPLYYMCWVSFLYILQVRAVPYLPPGGGGAPAGGGRGTARCWKRIAVQKYGM